MQTTSAISGSNEETFLVGVHASRSMFAPSGSISLFARDATNSTVAKFGMNHTHQSTFVCALPDSHSFEASSRVLFKNIVNLTVSYIVSPNTNRHHNVEDHSCGLMQFIGRGQDLSHTQKPMPNCAQNHGSTDSLGLCVNHLPPHAVDLTYVSP